MADPAHDLTPVLNRGCPLDCLIVSYSEPSRNRERHQFFNPQTKTGNGWGRFLHSNYVGFEGDIMLPNHLASIAKLTRERGTIEKTDDGFFQEADIATYSAWRIPLLGGLFLYQYLKSLSFSVDIVQHVQLEHDHFDQCLDAAPKVIGISTTLLLNPLDIADLVSYCRSRCPDAFIVLGGMSIWNSYLANPDNPDIFKGLRADAVVVDAKGLKTLGKLVDAVVHKKTLSDIPNLITYATSGTTSTPRQPEEFDFVKDGLRWNLIEKELVGNISLVRTQISCPFTCSFCSYPTSQGEVVKTELDAFEAELVTLRNRGVRFLLFVDDTFNVPPKRFKEMLHILKKYDFRWYAFIRCQYLDRQQVIDMRESGCGGAYLGIESANNEILKAMNKRATRDDYMRAVALLASEGIVSYGSFIIGFPSETPDAVNDTISFIENSGLDFFNVKIFYYDHTTPIAQEAHRYDLKGRGMNWSHTTMTSTEAFACSEHVIKTIKRAPYIPQHSGEIWEIAHFHERGYSPAQVRSLYEKCTWMLQDELSQAPNRLTRQKQIFQELVKFC